MGTPPPDRPPASFRRARNCSTLTDLERVPGSGLLDETDRVELFEGELIDKAPIGSRHAYTVDPLARKL